MARINLLPWREELREAQKKRFISVLLLVAGLSAVVVFFSMREVDAWIEHQQARNDFVKAEIRTLDVRIKEIKELKAKREELLARMKVIQDLQGNRPVIVRIFDEMARAVPDGVHFSSLQLKGAKLAVKGQAESNNRVSSLMRDFSESEWFTDPNLASVSRAKKAKAGGSGNSFNMSVTQIKPIEEEQK